MSVELEGIGGGMTVVVLFDWDRFRDYQSKMSKVEIEVIRRHFQAMVEGNSAFEDLSSAEMDGHFGVFEQSWIMARMFTERS